MIERENGEEEKERQGEMIQYMYQKVNLNGWILLLE